MTRQQDFNQSKEGDSAAAVAERENGNIDAPQNQPEGGSGGGTRGEGAFSEPGHRARLVENYNYDLMQELTELLQGVWRIDTYLKDAGGKCDDCGKIWQDVRKQKEYLIEKLRQEIVNHAKNGQFV